MSDDIDIEEHDVLDHPKIKTIFPDILSIKKEIVDVEEEIPEFSEESHLDYSNGMEEDDLNDTIDELHLMDPTSLHHISQNKIILGSNPAANEKDPFSVQVVIKDWKYILNKHPFFCQECLILFPTQNTMDGHKMAAHSLLVAVNEIEDVSIIDAPRPNIAKKSTTKSIAIIKNSTGSRLNKAVKSTAMINNVHSLLKAVNEIEDVSAEVAPRPNIAKKSTTKSIAIIKNSTGSRLNKAVKSTAMINNVHSLLKVVNEIEYVEDAPRPNICKKSTTKSIAIIKNNTGFRLNKAVKSTTMIKKEVDSVIESKPIVKNLNVSKKCPICKCYYLSDKNLHRHFVKNHELAHLTPITEPFNNQCPFCQYKGINMKLYNLHIQQHHNSIYKKSCASQKFKQQVLRTNSEHDLTFTSARALHQAATHDTSPSEDIFNSSATTGILFKCDKCTTHFVSCTIAFNHSAHHDKNQGEWKCELCCRDFVFAERNYHILQHKISDEFNVMTVTYELMQRVMCKCLKCGVMFDDTPTFWRGHALACVPTEYKTCECGLNIDMFLMYKHLYMHSVKLKPVVIHFMADTNDSTKSFPHHVLYYCYACKTYCHTKKQFHLTNRCAEVGIKHCICKLCGLCFSSRCFEAHLSKEHSKNKFKLTDVEFRNVKSDSIISPPLPEWMKCSGCQVNFFSRLALREHACYEDNFKKCDKCEEEFSDLAYKLHLPFHGLAKQQIQKTSNPENTTQTTSNTSENLEIPEILKQYESMQPLWNIIYQCEDCAIAFDNYDKVVEHSQDHFCSMENFDVQIKHCHACDVKFDGASYKKHLNFHVSGIKKDAFTILKFNHENLLKDDWLDFLSPISDKQRSHILTQSIYYAERSIRLELEVDGLFSNTFFKCSICNTIVDEDALLEHAKYQDACKKLATNYPCSLCNFVFPNKKAQSEHEIDHAHKLKHKTIRLITFNKEEDFETNYIMSKQNAVTKKYSMNHLTNKDSLKFNWCQECGLLIKKMDYAKHLYKHTAKKLGVFAKKVVKVKSNAKLYDIYKCVSCGVGVYHLKYAKSHSCLPPSHLTTCKYCHIKFRNSFMSRHLALHRKKPKFNKHTVKLIPFHPRQWDNIRLVYKKRQIRRVSPVTENLIKHDSPAPEGTIKDSAVSEKRAENDSSILKTPGKVTLYQCQICKACVLDKWKRHMHQCVSSPHLLVTCPICQLSFRRVKYAAHENLHNRYPGMTCADIEIIKYNFPMKRKLESISVPSKQVKVDPLLKQNTISESVRQSSRYRGGPTVYKCSCHLLFMCRETLVAHYKKCTTDRSAVKCPSCGLQFHKNDIEYHKPDRSCYRTSYLTGSIIIRNEHTHNADYWVFVCGKCDVYYTSLCHLKMHWRRDHLTGPVTPCSICNVKFPQSRYHVEKHHNLMKETISTLNQEVLRIVSISDLMKLNSRFGVKESDDPAPAPAPSFKTNTVKKSDGTELHVLYKCTDCNLHFTCIKTLQYHYKNQAHNRKKFACKYCGLHFTKILIRRHEKEEHTIDDYLVVVYADTNTRIDNASDINATQSEYSFEGTPSKRIPSPLKIPVKNSALVKTDKLVDSSVDSPKNTTEEKRVIEKLSKTPVDTLKYIFQCNICKVNCLHQESMWTHMTTSKHETSKLIKCNTCGLLFTSLSIKKHQFMHHTALQLKLEDLKIMVYYGGKKSILRKDVIVRELSISSIEHTIGAKTVLQTENTFGATSSHGHKIDPPTLYKCSLCDVYYTSYDMCREHTTNHTPLDSTEYITCKICDLQLICECLGVHMRGHREKTFNIDDLVVTECQPQTNGPPSTSTYLASKRLKNDLISTTTDCGN